jgi:hypothetical protein
MDIDAFVTQIKELLFQRGLPSEALVERAGKAALDYQHGLKEGGEVQSSSLRALADALNAEWLLVPTEHLRDVRRMLDAEGAMPDYSAPTAAELYLKSLPGTTEAGDE